MKSILEKALVHLLNEETEKAQELMHQFVVERAREIHEGLREGDEMEEDCTLEEELFTEADLDDNEAADQLADDLDDGEVAPEGDMGGEIAPEGDDMGAEADMEGEIAPEGDVEAEMGGEEVEGGDLTDKLDGIEDAIESLQAEFDKIMAEFEGGDDLSADAEDDGSEAIAMGDATEVTDGDEEFDDITESMVDDLKKVATPNEDGKGATGQKLSTPTVSPIAKDAKNTVLRSTKPVGHTGWDREGAPSKKEGPDRGRKYDNVRTKGTDGNAAVAATGPKKAELNKPVQGNSKSVIPGGKITKK